MTTHLTIEEVLETSRKWQKLRSADSHSNLEQVYHDEARARVDARIQKEIAEGGKGLTAFDYIREVLRVAQEIKLERRAAK